MKTQITSITTQIFRIKAIGFVLLVSLSFSAWSQDSISVISGDFIEDLIENNDEANYDFFSLYDELKTYLDNPLDINKATEEDLKSIGLFNSLQVEDILRHRADFGDFLSPYELQTIPSLDLGTLNASIPFLTTGSEVTSKNLFKLIDDASHSIVGKYKRVLQEKKGYIKDANDTSPYLGNADYYYTRSSSLL